MSRSAKILRPCNTMHGECQEDRGAVCHHLMILPVRHAAITSEAKQPVQDCTDRTRQKTESGREGLRNPASLQVRVLSILDRQGDRI